MVITKRSESWAFGTERKGHTDELVQLTDLTKTVKCAASLQLAGCVFFFFPFGFELLTVDFVALTLPTEAALVAYWYAHQVLSS